MIRALWQLIVRYRRSLLLTAGVFILIIATVAAFVANMYAHRNFRVVSPGQVYRSAQMDTEGLTRAIQEHGIKSILNLRGTNADDAWYKAETSTARQLGVQHYDFEMDAEHDVTDEDMQKVLGLMGSAPKPILIHCKSGADRTGLVAALYLYSVEGKTPDYAMRELSVFCGHIPYLYFRDTIAMDRSFAHYVELHAPFPNGGAKPTASLQRQDASVAATRVGN